MRTIAVSESTYERLTFAANLFGVSEEEVVERLVREFSGRPGGAPAERGAPAPQDDRRIRVRTSYRGTEASGWFDPLTNDLQITDGPASGKTYNSSTAAAIAVVVEVNPARRHPNTNGKNFWSVVDTDGLSLGAWLTRQAS